MAPWQHLYEKFQNTLGDSRYTWIDVWGLFEDDVWFAVVLDCRARATLPSDAAVYRQSLEDVKQYVRLRLCQRLREDPSLGFDKSRGVFKGWVEQIVTNACRDFWRRDRQQSTVAGKGVAELEFDPRGHEQESEQREARGDVWEVVERLQEPGRTILKMWSAGYAEVEIAPSLGLTIGQVRRHKANALNEFRRRWNRS